MSDAGSTASTSDLHQHTMVSLFMPSSPDCLEDVEFVPSQAYKIWRTGRKLGWRGAPGRQSEPDGHCGQDFGRPFDIVSATQAPGGKKK
jgi:hypothetical protein